MDDPESENELRLPDRRRELETLVDLYRHGRLEYKLHKTLEFFLFMCFSSLHIGDVKRLQLEQFTDTSFTYFRMKLKTGNRNRLWFRFQTPSGITAQRDSRTAEKRASF